MGYKEQTMPCRSSRDPLPGCPSQTNFFFPVSSRVTMKITILNLAAAILQYAVGAPLMSSHQNNVLKVVVAPLFRKQGSIMKRQLISEPLKQTSDKTEYLAASKTSFLLFDSHPSHDWDASPTVVSSN